MSASQPAEDVFLVPVKKRTCICLRTIFCRKHLGCLLFYFVSLARTVIEIHMEDTLLEYPFQHFK
jgi:hypothetical protein